MTSPPHIILANNQEINLDVSEPWSGCQPIKDNTTGNSVVRCEATRAFRSARERWWYLALSRCQNTTMPVCLDLLLKNSFCSFGWYFRIFTGNVEAIL